MLKAEKLTLGYDGNRIVEDVTLEVKKGDLITIVGVNGCGKSTLLKALSRSLKPEKGIVYLDGESIFKKDTKAIARKMAILPQGPKIPEDFTVKDLVSYGRHPYLGWRNQMKQKDFEMIHWAIKAAHIEHLEHRLVSTLSGGERQRAWLALALAQQPQILLLDEPTTFLDIGCQFEVLELVRNLNEQMGITVLMVLHDLNQAARYSKKMVVLKSGKIFKVGKPDEIVTQPILQEVFNVKAKVFIDEDNHCPYFIPMEGNKKSHFDTHVFNESSYKKEGR